MMVPVRCFSCGRVIADKWEEYNERVNQKHEEPGEVLDALDIKNYCCRRMLISHVDLIDDVINYGRR